MEKGKEVARVLNKTKQKLANHMQKKMRSHELTITQSILVSHVCRKGEMKISELGKILGLSNSTVSGLVDRL